MTRVAKKVDHGVLMVAYGTDTKLGKDYYTIKNSWGSSWGEGGYVRFVRDKNQCGVAEVPSYPTGVKAEGSLPNPSPPVPIPSGKHSHYGDPSGGCQTDERYVEIDGVSGKFCSPECSGILKLGCPNDVPFGVTASPMCVLQDESGHSRRCALTCTHSSQCGDAATCKTIRTISICTYDY